MWIADSCVLLILIFTGDQEANGIGKQGKGLNGIGMPACMGLLLLLLLLLIHSAPSP